MDKQMSCKILIVDDSFDQRAGYAGLLTRREKDNKKEKDIKDPYFLQVSTASTVEEALRILKSVKVDVLITDFYLDTREECLRLIEAVSRKESGYSPRELSIILTSTHDDADDETSKRMIEQAQLMWNPDKDGGNRINIVLKTKIPDRDKELFHDAVWNGVDKTIKAWARKHIKEMIVPSDNIFFTNNPDFIEKMDVIRRFAVTNETIMITGETGSGKEQMAKQIVAWSPRSSNPLTTVDCTKFTEELLGNELFGHVKGAFTGATTDKAGLFESAGKGTLLLDEIGELPLGMQGKLLRTLQEREIMPVGGTKYIKIDCRIIAATNRNLEKMVEDGSFRKDLYYRLNLCPIHIPPLRERRSDIMPLAQLLMNKYTEKNNLGRIDITDDINTALLSHDWPGNARELENFIIRIIITCDNKITVENVRKELTTHTSTHFRDASIFSLPTTNSRLQHLYLWGPAIKEIKKEYPDLRSMDISKQAAIFRKCIEKNYSDFFPSRDSKKPTNYYDLWEKGHRKVCAWCKESGPGIQ